MPDTVVGDLIKGQEVVSITGSEPVRAAARIMFDRKVGSVLVMDGDTLQGIFTERDALYLFVATRRNPDTTPVADVMTLDPATVGPDTTARAAFDKMNAGGYRHLPVVRDGKVIGVVSERLLSGCLG
ncbi:MAG: CBS domain-containing protein [Rhodobacterales bacterium]|nr:CBS domain-containing protein [Rhodobacterales bacterium]